MVRHPLPAALLLLAGCTGDATHYPSLAHRPIEDRGFAEPAAPAPTPVAADPALDTAIADADRQLAAIERGFGSDAAAAERAGGAAEAKRVGSDAWLDAQTALAKLDDWRSQLSGLDTDLEQRAIARAAVLAPVYPALAEIRERLAAEQAREGATIGRLAAALPGG